MRLHRTITARILLLAGFGIAVFPLFFRLGDAPLRVWDESLFAMRAYYAAETGSYLSNFEYFPGITFYRNLKPPLGTWFQALSYRCFGYTEWALRFPVAVFASLLIALLFIWGNRIAGDRYSGILAGAILVASPGFLRDHVARTGDHDAVLLLWMTGGALLCFALEKANTQNRRRLFLALLGLSLFLGFLTKSFFAFAFVPAFLLYLAWKRQLLPLLRDPFTWVVAVLPAGGIGLYYLRMELAFPGFWSFESDTVLGRYLKVQDGHQLAWHYYLTEFFQGRFSPWFLLLPLHLYLLSKSRAGVFRDFGILLWLCFSVHLCMICFSTTKLSWYDAPLYPVAALMAGSTAGRLIASSAAGSIRRALLVALASVTLGMTFYRGIQDATQIAPAGDDERYQPFMRRLQQERPDLKKYTIYCYEYNGQVGFTSRLLNDKYGYDISVAVYYPEKGFDNDTYIMVCSAEKEERIRLKHGTAVVAEQPPCRLLRITDTLAQ